MTKNFLPALAAIAVIAPASQAQNFNRFERTLEVRGDLQTPEGRREIRRINVDLNSNGTATLRLQANGNDWWRNVPSDLLFSGRWYGERREVTIDLNRLSNRTVFGTATIRFSSDFDRDGRRGRFDDDDDDDRFGRNRIGRGNGRFGARIEQISINARTGTDRWNTRNVSGVFTVDSNGNSSEYRGGINDLFTSRRGFGTVSINGRSEEVRSARVELERGGNAKITLEGRQTWFFEGRWRQTSRERIALTLDSSATTQSQSRRGGDWDRDNLGRGEIVLDGASISSLTLRGERGRDVFTASFNTRDRNGNIFDRVFGRGDWIRGDERGNILLDRSSGRGTFVNARGSRRLNQIRVRLEREGSARISFDGEGRDIELRGTWTRLGNDRYTVTVRGDDISGIATIRLEDENRGSYDREIEEFNFVGRDRFGNCSIRFES